ncbi:nitroreductase family protein [Williamsoniiplasma lucivorax]|uniref:NAD(P)H-dependent oxidoreductase n=1 Tax=Williamsoniiplasma lucivorax TaxID=209274 RepID=A0A2S5RDU6_9MOLU|nr:nitroreductase family protein [Williamsoniiplasma lucivorax]PPE05480.1 NAD(P)H-dependent oxidoreductase [Williamsoniiplasma lucivorax]
MKYIEKIMTQRMSPRRFDENHEIKPEDMDSIIEAMRMSPAAYGLFNTRLIRMPRSEFRDSLTPLFFNQPNFYQASEYLLFVVDKVEKLVSETIVKSAADMFGADLTKRDNYILSFQQRFPTYFASDSSANDWSAKQAYIMLGVGIVAAADLNIDVVPQEGFDHEKLNKLMVEQKLIEHNEMIVLGLALGKLTNGDFNHEHKTKVRRHQDEFIKIVK